MTLDALYVGILLTAARSTVAAVCNLADARLKLPTTDRALGGKASRKNLACSLWITAVCRNVTAVVKVGTEILFPLWPLVPTCGLCMIVRGNLITRIVEGFLVRASFTVLDLRSAAANLTKKDVPLAGLPTLAALALLWVAPVDRDGGPGSKGAN